MMFWSEYFLALFWGNVSVDRFIFFLSKDRIWFAPWPASWICSFLRWNLSDMLFQYFNSLLGDILRFYVVFHNWLLFQKLIGIFVKWYVFFHFLFVWFGNLTLRWANFLFSPRRHLFPSWIRFRLFINSNLSAKCNHEIVTATH